MANYKPKIESSPKTVNSAIASIQQSTPSDEAKNSLKNESQPGSLGEEMTSGSSSAPTMNSRINNELKELRDKREKGIMPGMDFTDDPLVKATQDLLDKKKAIFREIESKDKQATNMSEKENQQLNREISEIILRQDGKIRCLFNPQDPIFSLENETKMPTDEEI